MQHNIRIPCALKVNKIPKDRLINHLQVQLNKLSDISDPNYLEACNKILVEILTLL